VAGDKAKRKRIKGARILQVEKPLARALALRGSNGASGDQVVLLSSLHF
jgi:hypothetical protein